ncbi:MAG: Spy/CpxP family protein refolding chaperone [Bryobacteraceae bacterium]
MKALAVLLVLAGSSGALAQVPGMFPWWDSPIVRDLNLTEDQNRQIRTAVKESRAKLIQLRANVETTEGDFKDLINEDTIDVRKANETIDRMVAARSELTRAVSQLSVRLRAILTPQQWHELQRRQPQPQFRPDGRGMQRGPGRGPGPGPQQGPPGQPGLGPRNPPPRELDEL